MEGERKDRIAKQNDLVEQMKRKNEDFSHYKREFEKKSEEQKELLSRPRQVKKEKERLRDLLGPSAAAKPIKNDIRMSAEEI